MWAEMPSNFDTILVSASHFRYVLSRPSLVTCSQSFNCRKGKTKRNLHGALHSRADRKNRRRPLVVASVISAEALRQWETLFSKEENNFVVVGESICVYMSHMNKTGKWRCTCAIWWETKTARLTWLGKLSPLFLASAHTTCYLASMVDHPGRREHKGNLPLCDVPIWWKNKQQGFALIQRASSGGVCFQGKDRRNRKKSTDDSNKAGRCVHFWSGVSRLYTYFSMCIRTRTMIASNIMQKLLSVLR